MDNELTILSCPFCGKIPNIEQARNDQRAWAVICNNFGDGNTPPEESGCKVMPRTAWYISFNGENGKERAIRIWNKRVGNT